MMSGFSFSFIKKKYTFFRMKRNTFGMEKQLNAQGIDIGTPMREKVFNWDRVTIQKYEKSGLKHLLFCKLKIQNTFLLLLNLRT